MHRRRQKQPSQQQPAVDGGDGIAGNDKRLHNNSSSSNSSVMTAPVLPSVLAVPSAEVSFHVSSVPSSGARNASPAAPVVLAASSKPRPSSLAGEEAVATLAQNETASTRSSVRSHASVEHDNRMARSTSGSNAGGSVPTAAAVAAIAALLPLSPLSAAQVALSRFEGSQARLQRERTRADEAAASARSALAMDAAVLVERMRSGSDSGAATVLDAFSRRTLSSVSPSPPSTSSRPRFHFSNSGGGGGSSGKNSIGNVTGGEGGVEALVGHMS